MFAEHAFNMYNAKEIKKLVSVPVIVANRINDPKMADTLIKMGKTDFVAMGRGSIADPHLPNKAKEGNFEAIHYCIGCIQGCTNMTGMTCLVNPRVNREIENDMDKVDVAKNIMVIGGGPAGLMAAKTAAHRGHQVKVYEKTSHLGGAFRAAAYPNGNVEAAFGPVVVCGGGEVGGETAEFISDTNRNITLLEMP